MGSRLYQVKSVTYNGDKSVGAQTASWPESATVVEQMHSGSPELREHGVTSKLYEITVNYTENANLIALATLAALKTPYNLVIAFDDSESGGTDVTLTQTGDCKATLTEVKIGVKGGYAKFKLFSSDGATAPFAVS